MFVSGVTCAVAYGAVRRQDGWWAVISHTTRRAWEIHAAFLTLVVAIVVVVYWVGGDQLTDETNVRILLQQPGAALAHAAILQYRPVNTDVPPTFVLFHLLFAPLLWFLLKAPNVAIAASALLLGWSRSMVGISRNGPTTIGTSIRLPGSFWSCWVLGGS
jgi:hypothetical protein